MGLRRLKRKIKKRIKHNYFVRKQILNDENLKISIPNDIVLEVYFNKNCNCRCKFCSVGDQHQIKKEVIAPEVVYEYLKPLYDKVWTLFPTYGEITAIPEGYEYIKWLDENYPHINIFLETNGIAFNQKWQELAVRSLAHTHISVNAVDNESFKRTVWEEAKDGTYDRIEKNIVDYIALLKEKHLEALIPFVSTILNSTNYKNTLKFIEKALGWGCRSIGFYLDVHENSLSCKSYHNEKELVEALYTLAEVSRVLRGKVNINYTIYMPYVNVKDIQTQVEKMNLQELQEKYAALIAFAEKNSSDISELKEQQQKKGKRIRKEACFGSLGMQKQLDNQRVCGHPWHGLAIYPDGKIQCCPWREFDVPLNINDVVSDGIADWNKIFNSYQYRRLRKEFLENKYEGCKRNCSGIPCR